MRSLAILGSTGSIGTSTLEVVRAHPDLLSVRALAAGRNAAVSIAQAQAQLADPKARILLGANTDQLLVSADRRKNDQCHFSESGQRKTASAYAAAIKDFHASHP